VTGGPEVDPAVTGTASERTGTGGADPAAGTSPGPGVDRYGVPVYDPSSNVYALVRAAIQRQDDLRSIESGHIREMAGLRSDFESRLRDADRRQADLRAGYEEKLRQQESARIDAIRAVDVGAVTRAAEVSATQAATLATQQQASADALRGQVEQARIATADALAQALAPITKSIEDLRAAQYQQQGEKSSKVETGTSERDALAIEQARIQAAQARMQMIALVFGAIVLALAVYAAFHKLRCVASHLPGHQHHLPVVGRLDGDAADRHGGQVPVRDERGEVLREFQQRGDKFSNGVHGAIVSEGAGRSFPGLACARSFQPAVNACFRASAWPLNLSPGGGRCSSLQAHQASSSVIMFMVPVSQAGRKTPLHPLACSLPPWVTCCSPTPHTEAPDGGQRTGS